MGFEIERKSRSPELWDVVDDSASNALVKEGQNRKESDQPSVRKKDSEPNRKNKVSTFRKDQVSPTRKKNACSLYVSCSLAAASRTLCMRKIV